MTDMYFIRHCEAVGNVKRLIQGVIDTDVTEVGKMQLEYLGKRFDGIDIDAVYASPLKRTVATAHAVADRKGLEIITDKGFIEADCGVFEGVPFEVAFADPALVEMWNTRPYDFEPEGGESERHAYERIWETTVRVARENKNKRIAVATHGGVLRSLITRIKFGAIEHLGDVPYGFNTAVTLVRFDDNMNPTLVFFNDDSHLPPECIPEESRVPETAGDRK